jgi:hypothetical protein
MLKIWQQLQGWLTSLLAKLHRPTAEEIAEKRGEDSEARVFKICWDMMVWNETPPRVTGQYPYRTPKWSPEDRKGIDIIFPSDKGNIHIQVKSSSRRWQEFVNDVRNKETICVNGQNDEQKIMTELKKKLWIQYNRLTAAPNNI